MDPWDSGCLSGYTIAISPQIGPSHSTEARVSILTMRISSRGLSDRGFTLAFSIADTTSFPFVTLPNTVCLLSSHGVATVVMKN